MQFLPLYLVVFISGASVLAVEILGTRLLGPFYGVSLFLWSALITVTLAALSVGYTLGGRLADRGPRYGRLGLILGIAGVWLMFLPWIKRPLLDLTGSLGLRGAVLVTSTLLFFVPLTLLGMVSPYAIRLRAARLEEVGRTAGDIYAISTLASVVAALLTGFVLIPNTGVASLMIGIGVFLVVGAVIAVLGGRGSKVPAVGLLLVAAGGTFLSTLPLEGADPSRGILTVRHSPYAEIRVVDWENTRLLFIDGGGHTIVERDNWKSLYPYAKVMDLCKYFYSEAGELCLVGLGGGSIVKSYDQTGWNIDVVEIDPVVVDVAYEYFGLEPREAEVFTMDGRQFFLTHEKRYDLIILDAFGSSAIPFHLVTEEAFGLVASRLQEGGVVAMNIEANGWHDKLVYALGTTLRQHFQHVAALPLAEPRNAFGNLVILASNRELEFPEEMLGRPSEYLDDRYEHWTVLQRIHAWDNRFEPVREGQAVLTDDRNPVDLWAEEINLVARRALHNDFEWRDLAY